MLIFKDLQNGPNPSENPCVGGSGQKDTRTTNPIVISAGVG